MKQITIQRFRRILKFGSKVFLFLLIFFYAFINIFSSQNISPLYFAVAKENRLAVVDFLSQIKKSPDFDTFLTMNKNIYGESLEPQVFAENLKRKQTIEEYEKLLKQIPSSRDVLYNLYLLYHEEGDETKAKDYLDRAQEIDPTLNP